MAESALESIRKGVRELTGPHPQPAPKPSKRVEARWEAGRKLWEDGAPVEYIASLYNVTVKAMGARIQKFRRLYSWFEPRSIAAPLSLVANSIVEKNDPKTRTITFLIPLHTAVIWHAYDGFRDIHYTIEDKIHHCFLAAELVQPPQFRGHGEFALVKVRYGDYKFYTL